MRVFTAFLVGLLFGTGLIVSGMMNPAKVLGFLDVTGLWDPSLALVMAGAIAVGIVFFRLARGRKVPLLGGSMQLPTRTDLDRRLLVGSAVFGLGWGLAGICPGPGIVALGAGYVQGLIFVLAMLAGMALFELIEYARTRYR